MKYRSPKALEQAVKAAARASEMDTNQAMAGFFFHRLLCRVFSDPDSPFVLKGGQGMLARAADARRTRDIDLSTSEIDIDSAVSELRRAASTDLGDFVSFRYLGCDPIKADDEYRDGYKVRFAPFIGAKVLDPISIDLVADEVSCGTPDTVVPADRLDIAGLAVFDYRVYPAIAGIADKVCSIAEIRDGRPSSRVKDLVDLVIYFQTEDLDGAALRDRIILESRLRKMQPNLPFGVPDAWVDSYGAAYRKSAMQAHLPEAWLELESARDYVARCLDALCIPDFRGAKWSASEQRWI